ncbi:hypothetical protein C5S35_08280 [Candidatus Methanophagaceae archaeon]|nr:hypothetical protein C5S35_08280 [Methanophagales archaeon]
MTIGSMIEQGEQIPEEPKTEVEVPFEPLVAVTV